MTVKSHQGTGELLAFAESSLLMNYFNRNDTSIASIQKTTHQVIVQPMFSELTLLSDSAETE